MSADKKIEVRFDERKIDDIFGQIDQCHLPGAAVGIALAGSPLYRKGFGLASAELPVVLSSKIRMRLFSVSKHFTCLAYLLLCEDGRASIDDPIGKYNELDL
jgi:D-aminopeptidase